MLSIDEIYQYSESEDELLKTEVAKIIIIAINDWPTPVDSIESFLHDLKVTLRNQELSTEVINQYLKSLKPSVDAWKMESLTGLLEALSLTQKDNLEDVFDFLKN